MSTPRNAPAAAPQATPQNQPRRFEYAALPFAQVVELIDARPSTKFPDSYLSEDVDSIALPSLLAAGFRWVRTDGDMAIFERETAP